MSRKRGRAHQSGLVINDLHFPFHDQRAIDLVLKVADALQPARIFLNGDITDCWEISRFDKNPQLQDAAGLRPELAQTRDFLRALRGRFPRARIDYLFGNHEYRWSVFIARNARELHGLRGMTLEEQLECSARRINVVNSGNKENSVLWGKLLIGHFNRVNKHSAYTGRNLLEDKSISLIQGHTHRGGSSFKRAYDRDIVAYENFCLCDRSPAYVDRPNWQLGFSVVYKDPSSDFFYVEQHPIIEDASGYRVFFNGECFS
jgi:hypothetical protein